MTGYAVTEKYRVGRPKGLGLLCSAIDDNDGEVLRMVSSSHCFSVHSMATGRVADSPINVTCGMGLAMEGIESYLTLAGSTSVVEFVAQFDVVFLLKRPLTRAMPFATPAKIDYETKLTKLEVDPYATEWRIVRVKKREGNPYPERISVGRATNCDIVIRLPSISKVHAHIVRQGPGSYALTDNAATNATFVNGRRVNAKTPTPLRVGDGVAFGSVDLEFVDAGRLYEILRSEVDTSKLSGSDP